jgi:hypothetical protein
MILPQQVTDEEMKEENTRMKRVIEMEVLFA